LFCRYSKNNDPYRATTCQDDNVVNIKLHNDTIHRLEEIIRASTAEEEDKSTLISTLRPLPEDAIKHLNLT